MRRQAWGLVLVLGVLLGVQAPAAGQSDTGFFLNGMALVGEKPFNCSKTGSQDPVGRGLTFGQAKDLKLAPAGPNKDRVYRLTGFYQSAAKGQGFLDVCGYLTKVAGIGPRCGWSKGYNGKGLIRYANGDVEKLSNIEWKLGTGILPIIGRVHKYDQAGGQKTKPGRIVGVAQVQPDGLAGESCTTEWNPLNADRANKGRGARRFVVHGVFQVQQLGVLQDWNFYTDQVDPKNDGKSSPSNIWGDKKNDKPVKPPQ